MPARFPSVPREVLSAALARVRAADGPAREDLRLLTKHYLGELCRRAPGRSVEVRIPPYAVGQCIPGARHTRGTPPAVVETDPLTWVLLASGELSWEQAVGRGAVVASGERSDLSWLLPLSGDNPK